MDEVALQLNPDSGQVEMTVAQVGLPARLQRACLCPPSLLPLNCLQLVWEGYRPLLLQLLLLCCAQHQRLPAHTSTHRWVPLPSTHHAHTDTFCADFAPQPAPQAALRAGGAGGGRAAAQR